MNPWHNPRLAHALARMLIGAVLLALIATAASWLTRREVFDLRLVRVEAVAGHKLRQSSESLLRATISQRIHGSFFAINLDEVRAVVETVPWVRRAQVRRLWPNRLVVAIEEHRPLALWEDGRLVNTYGELFSANLDEAEEDGALPQFGGPKDSEGTVVRRYAELRDLLAPLGSVPVAVNLSARHAWSAQLDDGTRLIIGREQGVALAERIRRWVAAYPAVKAQLNSRAEVVDLRYPNGFALRSLSALGDPAPLAAASVNPASNRTVE